uniref:cytochrome P450 4F2-like n=1 Tax=Styela clava TaxID=7725 RepID=UPI00193ACB52|nr:cytochrome P450 4F2-like [Styela clava]
MSEAVKDVGCAKRHWFFGHIRKLTPNEAGMRRMVKWMKKFPKVTLNWFGPFTFVLSTYHPDIIKPVLGSDTPKDNVSYRFMRPWIGDGLLTSYGDKWKRNRRLLTPAFHFDILKRYLVCFNDSVAELIKKWSTSSENCVSVELFTDISAMTLDNLLQCILSKKSGCQSGKSMEYLNAIKCITEGVVGRLRNPLYHFDLIFYLSPAGKKFKEACKTVHSFSSAAINERKSSLKHGNERDSTDDTTKLDFLDIMLLAKDDNGIGMSHQEICDEVDTFVFEGHDTVSSGICWIIYNLATNPEHQEICRNEVFEVLGEQQRVKYENLFKFKYLTMCIKESMRLHPPVPSVGRKMNKPFFFSNGFGPDQYNTNSSESSGPESSKIIHTNTLIGVSIYRLHRNPCIWSNPEVFDPERFTPENRSKRSSHAYVPFSAGSRNCIGQNFAMNEMKVTLALALQRFRFSLDETYPKPAVQPQLVLRSTTGIHVKLEKLE